MSSTLTNRSDRRHSAALSFIFVTVFLDMMSMGLVGPVLPALIEQFAGSSETAAVINGTFMSVWALAQIIASPIIGALSDRFGRRPVILLSTAGLAANYVIMAPAPNVTWLACGRVIAGLTAATVAGASAYTADITPQENRARAYGIIGAAFSLGLIAGPLFGGVLGTWSLRAPFWASSALSLCAFLYGALVLPESLPAEWRMPFTWKRANPLGPLRLLRSHRELFGFARVIFLDYSGVLAFPAPFILYANLRYGWGPWETGMAPMIWGVLALVVQSALVSPVSRRLGSRRTLLLGLVLSALGYAAMGLASRGHQFLIALLPAAMGGLVTPALMALMASEYPPRSKASCRARPRAFRASEDWLLRHSSGTSTPYHSVWALRNFAMWGLHSWRRHCCS